MGEAAKKVCPARVYADEHAHIPMEVLKQCVQVDEEMFGRISDVIEMAMSFAYSAGHTAGKVEESDAWRKQVSRNANPSEPS